MSLEYLLRQYISNPNLIKDEKFFYSMCESYYNNLFFCDLDLEYLPEHPEFKPYRNEIFQLKKMIKHSALFAEMVMVNGDGIELIPTETYSKEFINNHKNLILEYGIYDIRRFEDNKNFFELFIMSDKKETTINAFDLDKLPDELLNKYKTQIFDLIKEMLNDNSNSYVESKWFNNRKLLDLILKNSRFDLIIALNHTLLTDDDIDKYGKEIIENVFSSNVVIGYNGYDTNSKLCNYAEQNGLNELKYFIKYSEKAKSAFIDLTKDENLSRIDIDPRLINCFKRAMIYFQRYFTEQNLIFDRNYELFFEKFLIKDNQFKNKKISIKCSNVPRLQNAAGIYLHNVIIVDEKYLDNEDILTEIMAHEFIHFLVMHDVKQNNNNQGIVEMGPFCNEGFTELLAREVCQIDTSSYDSQVKMIKFIHILQDKEINFKDFLLKGEAHFVNEKLINLFNNYHNRYKGSSFDSIFTNPEYLGIQRQVISQYIDKVYTLDDYAKIVEKLSNRPHLDYDYMYDFYRKLDQILLSTINIPDKVTEEIYRDDLRWYRRIIEDLSEDKNFREAYCIDISNHKIQITKNGQVFLDGIYHQIATGNKFSIKIGNQEHVIDMNNAKYQRVPIDEQSYNRNLESKREYEQKLRNIFNQKSTIIEDENISEEKIEEFKNRVGMYDWTRISPKVANKIEQFRISFGDDEYTEDEYKEYEAPYRRSFDPSYSRGSIEQLLETIECWDDDLNTVRNFYEYDKLNDEEKKLFDILTRRRHLELLSELKEKKSKIQTIQNIESNYDDEDYTRSR